MSENSTGKIVAGIGQVSAAIAVINPAVAGGVVMLLIGSAVAYKILTRAKSFKFVSGNINVEANFYR